MTAGEVTSSPAVTVSAMRRTLDGGLLGGRYTKAAVESCAGTLLGKVCGKPVAVLLGRRAAGGLPAL